MNLSFHILYLDKMPQPLTGIPVNDTFRTSVTITKKTADDKMDFDLRLQRSTFDKCWKGWTGFIKLLKSDFK